MRVHPSHRVRLSTITARRLRWRRRYRCILGAKVPRPFTAGWRMFYTQQHGDNTTWEIIPALR